MTSADVPLLLDTNIVVHLLRGRAAVLTTDKDFQKLSQVLDVHWVDPEMLKEIERS